eukprot:Anaeramoba_flamelloidesa1054819_41.p1 GENE.a1054819_41~~a1054819_41.p1  ORF type:complete len:122 (+),score=17.01 a1054819_41:161-526(+)
MSGIGNFILQTFLEKFFVVTNTILKERKTTPKMNLFPLKDQRFRSISQSLGTLTTTVAPHVIQALVAWRDKLISTINKQDKPLQSKQLKKIKSDLEKTLNKMMTNRTITPTTYVWFFLFFF